MARRRWAVGVDFGGTNTRLGLVDGRGRVARAAALPTSELRRPADFIERVADMTASLARTQGLRPAQLAGVGVGAPGPVDGERGVVHFLVNVPGWREVPLAERLQRRLRCRCLIENDANLFTLGEWRFGAGRGARQLVGLTLGTGVGGGLIVEGRLVRGASGAAGEIGHLLIDPRGHRCGCGRRGCLEAEAGTAAILRLGRRALRESRGPLRRLIREARGPLTPALISRAARLGDAAARRVWAAVGRSLGIGLGSVVTLLNPDRIVIGGGVSNAWGLFSPALIAALRAQAMSVSARAVQVVRAGLGGRAGILGAAVLVWESHVSASTRRERR